MANDLTLFEAAWRILEPELKTYEHGANTFEQFVEALTNCKSKAGQESPLANSGAFLDLATAAKRLGVCRKSMELWARTGRIASFRRGRCVRIPESAIAALVSGQQEMPNNQVPKKAN